MEKQRLRGSQYTIEMSNLYAGGLITIELVFLQQMLAGGSSNPGVSVAEIAFSVALPALTGILVANTIQSQFPYRLSSSQPGKLLQILFLLGVLASIVGIDGMLWSISLPVVLTFTGSALFTSFIVILYVSTLSNEP
ncbi:MAG: hypothetical protein NVS2B12_37770 [Ktedonobacteraceae bacterium]